MRVPNRVVNLMFSIRKNSKHIRYYFDKLLSFFKNILIKRAIF
ncbi:hypothetical protein HMPREF9997_00233 [Corynebacterium durum F0235]|uniref:Uncharacterized protein n=1 Tax=Corynebacterium durum F0235 TaxID=1035195 RepID=L1MNQ3_9CORY|nr:hypothetical protein HMPREF9997_00233 [Corynebacterium durum F0235]